MKKAKLAWSQDAEIDLLEIRRRIQRDGLQRASRFTARLKESVNRLRMFPESGAKVEDIPIEGIREIPFRQYRVLYHYEGLPAAKLLRLEDLNLESD